MKAVVTREYGDVAVLELQDVEKPSIQDDEILVRIHAFSINPVDWKIRRGEVRLFTGRKPPKILGVDYAGEVAEVGNQITDYKTGDPVFGMVSAFKGGTYAEYAKVKREQIALKPENLSFEEAASLPVVSLTAYQSLVHKGQLKEGDHVVINGCSGGVGLCGLQIAKALGSRLTGVCSTQNLELAKKMGADIVIDYKVESVLKDKGIYNIFLDAVGNCSGFEAKAALKPGGIYVTTLPSFQTMVLAPFVNMVSSKKITKIMVSPSNRDLVVVRKMVEDGKLVPVLEKIYSLDEIQQAHTRSESGRVVGKIVVKVI